MTTMQDYSSASGDIGTTDGLIASGDDLLLSQADLDALRNLIYDTTHLWNDKIVLWRIIRENVYDFFNGQSTVQDTVRIIQSRVTIYLSEQS